MKKGSERPIRTQQDAIVRSLALTRHVISLRLGMRCGGGVAYGTLTLLNNIVLRFAFTLTERSKRERKR